MDDINKACLYQVRQTNYVLTVKLGKIQKDIKKIQSYGKFMTVY